MRHTRFAPVERGGKNGASKIFKHMIMFVFYDNICGQESGHKEGQMTISDEGETIGLFEPLMASEYSPARAGLNDLVFELAEKSAAFRSGLPASIAEALADLVRTMNCYYLAIQIDAMNDIG